MTAAHRWLVVGLGVLLLVTAPTVIRSLPVDDSDVSAATLLERVKDSASVGYSGYAESVGGLSLPVTDRFGDVATLLGDRTRLRVWWRSPVDWRVDAIGLTGETDLFRGPGGLATWEYEASRVTYTTDAPVRLPRTADLVPAVLGRHVLGEARPDEVTRLPSERVAGREAPGLRLTPSDPRTTVDHADVWVDAQTGLALRVTVYGSESSRAVTTSFLDLTISSPAAVSTAFSPPPGAEVQFEAAVDIAAAADKFAPFRPPGQLAGLRRRVTDAVGAVGHYGRGVTRLVAIPLQDEDAHPVRDQLLKTSGAREGRRGVTITVGPLNLLVTNASSETSHWLLAGTVTRRTLLIAADELAVGARSLL